MWGWKAVERLIEPSVPFDDAKQRLQQYGFQLHASHPGFAVFKRAGKESPWTTAAPDAGNVALELALTPSHAGLYLQLRYDTFVMFDTGDLGQVVDEIAGSLAPAENSA